MLGKQLFEHKDTVQKPWAHVAGEKSVRYPGPWAAAAKAKEEAKSSASAELRKWVRDPYYLIHASRLCFVPNGELFYF